MNKNTKIGECWNCDKVVYVRTKYKFCKEFQHLLCEECVLYEYEIIKQIKKLGEIWKRDGLSELAQNVDKT